MSERLTPTQFSTLDFIAMGGGQTALMTYHWRDRHHQALLRRHLLRLRVDPFKTKADMLRGWITAKGRAAVKAASQVVRAQAKANADRDYARYVSEEAE